MAMLLLITNKNGCDLYKCVTIVMSITGYISFFYNFVSCDQM